MIDDTPTPPEQPKLQPLRTYRVQVRTSDRVVLYDQEIRAHDATFKSPSLVFFTEGVVHPLLGLVERVVEALRIPDSAILTMQEVLPEAFPEPRVSLH